jgi:phage terminase small subunit
MRRDHKEFVVVTVSEKKSFYAPDDNGTMRKQTIEKEIPQIVEIPARLTDANKAAETLAKMQGGFDNTFKLEMTVPRFEGEDSLED